LDSSAAGALSSWASSSSKGYQKISFIQHTINIDRFTGRPGFTMSHVQRASQSIDGKKKGAETNTNKNKNQWQRFFFDSIFYLILFFAFFVKFFFSSSFVVCGLNNY